MGSRIDDLLPMEALATTHRVEVTKSPGSRRVTIQELIDFIFANPSGALPILHGGTGQTTRGAALDALLPAQAGNAGKTLQTDGTNATWQTAAGGVTLGSSGGTLVITGSGGTYNLEIATGHSTTFTTPQVFQNAAVSPVRVATLPDNVNFAAGRFENTAGAATSVLLAKNNRAGEFTNGAISALLGDGSYAVYAAGAPSRFAGGLQFETAFGAFGTAPVGQQSANAALTDSTGGAASTTLAACGDTTAADQSATINSNFASLAARNAELRALLLTYGLGA